MDDYTVLPGDILQFVDKLGMCQIRHLPTPELRHTCEAKILDEDSVVLTAKFVCKLPLPGITLVDNALIQSCAAALYDGSSVCTWRACDPSSGGREGHSSGSEGS